MGVSAAVTQRPTTASPKRNSPANAAVIPHRQTNTPHATSSGPDWPYTPHMQRKRSRPLPAVGEVTEVDVVAHDMGDVDRGQAVPTSVFRAAWPGSPARQK